jgi:hypothetical protein
LSLRASAYNAAALHLSYAGFFAGNRPLKRDEVSARPHVANSAPFDETPKCQAINTEMFSDLRNRFIGPQKFPDLWNVSSIKKLLGTATTVFGEARPRDIQLHRASGAGAGGHAASSGIFIPQSEGGADLPMEASAAFNATYVFAGNRALLSSTQLAAALYFRPVKLATALVPPRAAATSRVVVRVPDCLLMPNTLSN